MEQCYLQNFYYKMPRKWLEIIQEKGVTMMDQESPMAHTLPAGGKTSEKRKHMRM